VSNPLVRYPDSPILC